MTQIKKSQIHSTENGYCIKDSKKYTGQTPLTPRHTIDAILGLNDRCDNIGGELLKNQLVKKSVHLLFPLLRKTFANNDEKEWKG
jgi:hypothetical protein